MEVWILLAAAGSGYLMQCWQKSRACALDDDDSSCASSCPPMSKCGNSFADKRGKGTYDDIWHLCGLNEAFMRSMCVVDDKENEGHGLQKDAVGDKCNCSNARMVDYQGFILSNSCLASPKRSARVYDGFSSVDQCSSKYVEDVLDDEVINEPHLFLFHQSPSPSYCGIPQYVSEPYVESMWFNMEVDGRCRRRDFRPLGKKKSGRSDDMKRITTHPNQMTYLESCLRARIDEEFWQADTSGHSSTCDAVQENVGFPLLPKKLRLRMPTTCKAWGCDESLVKKRAVAATFDEGSLCHSCFPLMSQGRRWRRNSRSYLGPLDSSQSCNFQDRFSSGVGITFTILSDRFSSKASISSLEEAMGLLQGLEAEVRDAWKFSSSREIVEDVLIDQRDKMLGKLKNIMGLVEHVRVSLGPAPAMKPLAWQKEMAKLEAELEVELERMEQSLNYGDILEAKQKDSSSMECDAQVGTLIKGELSARGIPCDVEVELEDEGSADSLHRKDAQLGGDHTVPPHELALRLHEVLEDRQEQHILELEAKVKHLNSRLQANEDEVQYWKKRFLPLSPGVASHSSSSAEEKGGGMVKKTLLRGLQEEIFSSWSMQHSSPSSPGPNPPLFHHEDYDEICDEFCQLWGDMRTNGTPFAVSNRPHTAPVDVSAHNEHLNWLCRSSYGGDSEHLSQNTSTGGTPCAMKFMAKQTDPCNKVESGQETLADKGLEWAGGQDLTVHCEAPVKPLVCNAQDVIDIFEAHDGQDWRSLEWSLSEDSSYLSDDTDEQMGRLLIKRIVEKSRRGSSIVEVARSVMASFDGDGAI